MILIAEDELLTKLLIEQVLSNLQYPYVIVDSGVDVIEWCNKQKFTCMLIDMQMPEINGIEAIDYIRNQSELNAQTPIYIFSGNYPPDYNKLVEKYSIQGIILKPFTIKEIEQLINKIKEK